MCIVSNGLVSSLEHRAERSRARLGTQAELPFFVAELPAGKRLGNLIAVCTQIGDLVEHVGTSNELVRYEKTIEHRKPGCVMLCG